MMVVAALTHRDLILAERALSRAYRRFEVLAARVNHDEIAVDAKRWRRAICALQQAVMVERAAAERDRVWYRAHRRARQRPPSPHIDAMRLAN